MAWSFILANQAGVTIDVLDTAVKQAELEFVRNEPAKCIVQLDADDDRASTFISQLVSITPRIYCYRDGILEFAGFLTSVEQTAESEAQLTATFEDALAALRYRISDADLEYYSQNSASIIAGSGGLPVSTSLLSQANASAATGLVAGSVTANTVVIAEMLISREIILDRVLEIARMTGGPDVRCNPQAQGATLGTLDVGQLYTGTTAAAHFFYGPGTAANVLSVAQQITPPQTRVIVIGNEVEATSTTTATITTAEGAVGRWEVVQQRSDLESVTDCQNTADADVRAAWTQTINFTPDPAVAAVPLKDYNVGDPVEITAVRGSILCVAEARVNKIGLTIDNSGVEDTHRVECEIGNAVVTSPAAQVGATTITTSNDAPLTSSTESLSRAVTFRK